MRKRVKIWSVAGALMAPLLGVMAFSFATLVEELSPRHATSTAGATMRRSESMLARRAPRHYWSAGRSVDRAEARRPAGSPTSTAPPTSGQTTLLLSIVSSVVSTLGAVSTIVLAWRSDRRAVRELEAKLAKLEGEVA